MQEMYNFYFFNTKCWTMFELFRLYKKHKTNKLWILWFDFILFFQNFLLLSLQFLSIQAEYKMLSLKGTIYPKAEQLSWQWRIWHSHPEQAALEAIFFHLHKTSGLPWRLEILSDWQLVCVIPVPKRRDLSASLAVFLFFFFFFK
jgi:hypothetical protein